MIYFIEELNFEKPWNSGSYFNVYSSKPWKGEIANSPKNMSQLFKDYLDLYPNAHYSSKVVTK